MELCNMKTLEQVAGQFEFTNGAYGFLAGVKWQKEKSKTNNIEKIYIVGYSKGSYSDYQEINIFATSKKSTATKYVTRFNKILKQLEEDNKKFEKPNDFMNWIKDDCFQYYRRWSEVREINNAFWEELKLR